MLVCCHPKWLLIYVSSDGINTNGPSELQLKLLGCGIDTKKKGKKKKKKAFWVWRGQGVPCLQAKARALMCSDNRLFTLPQGF